MPPQLTVKKPPAVAAAGYGYQPGYFASPKVPKIPKGLQVDYGVPGNARPLPANSFLQDPGVPGQMIGDYRPPPVTYTYGTQRINLDPNYQGGAFDPSTITQVGKGQGDGTSSTNPLTNPWGSSRPDLQALIAGDWEVQGAETNAAQRLASIRSQFTEGLRRALVNLGVGDSSKLGKFGSYIDQDTLTNAINNKYSANAQIQQSQDRSQVQLENALAARGMLQSGAATVGSADIAADAEKSRYDALQQFLGTGEQGLGDISNEEYTQGQNIAQARSNAGQRASAYDLGWLNWQAANPATAGAVTPLPAPPVTPQATPQAPQTTPAAPRPIPKPANTYQPFTTDFGKPYMKPINQAAVRAAAQKRAGYWGQY